MATRSNLARSSDMHSAHDAPRVGVTVLQRVDVTPRPMRGILIGAGLSLGLWAAPAAALWRILG